MNRRNRGLRTAAALAIGMLAVSACDNGLTEVNQNPNAPENVPLNTVLLRGMWDINNNSALFYHIPFHKSGYSYRSYKYICITAQFFQIFCTAVSDRNCCINRFL